MSQVNVGVVGYSAQDFNRNKAKQHLEEAFDKIKSEHDEQPIIISGLTDQGIPALAYREASERGWKTVGIACKKADEYKCYPVDKQTVRDEWEEWGDESEEFLSRIDVMVRVGGGKQTKNEIGKAREKGITIEYEGEC